MPLKTTTTHYPAPYTTDMDETRLEIQRADARAAMEACEGGEIECSRCHEYDEAEDMGRTPWQRSCHSSAELETQHRISKL